jgi:ureidoglycolate lyase
MSETALDLSPDPASLPDLPGVEIPLVEATRETLEGYGELIDGPEARAVEIVRWPAQGWRQVDPGTGDEGGTTDGDFTFWWEGGTLRAANEAVNDAYMVGWTSEGTAPADGAAHMVLWHANYHPDGGQLFFPLESGAFIITLALPGDDVKPEDFRAFHFSGGKGLYIHPNVWHETIVPLSPRMRFFDRQGKVHARISVDFGKEFGVYPLVPLRAT